MTSLSGMRLRATQEELMAYESGRVAISAVPGSGKTLSLALLAAKIVMDGRTGDEGEVLVVTVQNSAVDNISQRIRRLLTEQKRPPVGYRVCTLHKLANDIVRLRPDLAGIADDYHVVDESDAQRAMRQAAEVVIAQNRDWWTSFVTTARASARPRLTADWLADTVRIGFEVAKLCKHLRISPDEAKSRFGDCRAAAPFSWLGLELYSHYQGYLRAQAGLDFDDLIWRAVDAIEQDPAFLANLRKRWPYILEDEAQDSSPLQENVLRRLAGPEGNWIRVGDPNQAINSTFTSADPRFFRRYLEEAGVRRLALRESGRSGRPIIAAANALVDWVCSSHSEPLVRTSAFEHQYIVPTGPGDAQQNPPDEECHIYIRGQPFASVDDEARFVANRAARYVAEHLEHSVAILCPASWHGERVVESLRQIPGAHFEDLLNLTPQARNVARMLSLACHYLADPTARPALASLFAGLVDEGVIEGLSSSRVKHASALLRSVPTYDILFPRTPGSLAARLPPGVPVDELSLAALDRFAILVSRWVRIAPLPVDQLLLALGQDLFADDAGDRDLGSMAVCHTIAQSLGGRARDHIAWRLEDYAVELGEIARNRRGLRELSLPDAAYLTKEGTIAVTTVHKAKGLEWDTVYLMCVDSIEFPGTMADAFRDEPAYLPGRAPVLEARLVLEGLLSGNHALSASAYVEQGRLETIAERLRLLYVGVTRAKRNVSLTFSAKNGRHVVRPASALAALQPLTSPRAALDQEAV